MSDTDEIAAEVREEAETPEQVRARKVAAFAAYGPRYERLADALLGADDPSFALAHLLVDHEARLDALGARLRHLEAAEAQKR